MMINQRPARLDLSEYVRNQYTLPIPKEVKLEHVLDENFWANVAMTLKPWDRIEIQPADMSYHAVVVVIATDRLWAKVALLSYTELRIVAVQGDLVVQWSGPHTRFRVMRGADVLKDNFTTKVEAETWRDNHAKAA
jgi:hypothetical protein